MIHHLRKLTADLQHECTFVGGVVDWFYFGQPVRDIDVCSPHGHAIPGAEKLGGKYFGDKWRFRYGAWMVECFLDPEPNGDVIAGVRLQTPARRLAVIQQLLDLPPSAWMQKKRDRLEALVVLYREIVGGAQ